MLKASRLVVLSALVLALVLSAVVAQAKPASWKFVDVTLHYENEQSRLIVSGELPDGVKPPRAGELAVPAGAQLQWIGEILGGDTSADPDLKYELSSKDGQDTYRFELTRGRIAQIEAIVPSAVTFDGTNYRTDLQLKAFADAPELRISEQLPKGAKVVQADPAASVAQDGDGNSYYTKTLKDVKKGDDVSLVFSYALAAPAASGGSSTGASTGSDRIAVGLIGVLFIAGVMWLVLNVQRKVAEKRGDAPVAKKSSASASKAAAVQASKSVVAKGDGASRAASAGKSRDADHASEVEPKRVRPLVPMLIVIALLIGAFFLVTAKGTSSAVVNGKITRNFGSASSCQAATVAYTTNNGADLAKEGEKLLKVFEGKEGVGIVSLDLEQSKIDLEWCESSQSPDSMKQALESTGLLTLGEFVSKAPTPK